MMDNLQNHQNTLQNYKDLDDLKLLSIFHYIVAGISVCLSCVPGIYVVMGIVFLIVSMQPPTGDDPPPPFVGLIFIVIGAVLIFMILLSSALIFYAGRCLKQQKAWIFCIVVAVILILGFNIFSTTLGVFSMIVLMRPSVKALFERQEPFQSNQS